MLGRQPDKHRKTEGRSDLHWSGFDEKILSLYARGMTVREMQGHLEEMYDTEVSHALILSAIDDAKAEGIKDGRICGRFVRRSSGFGPTEI